MTLPDDLRLPHGRRTVLIVEGSGMTRALLRAQLDQEYRVIEAADGHQALEAAQRERPDAILIDVELPGLDGYEVLDRVQADSALADVPVVFLTGRSDPADVADALRRGAHDYLRKPFEQSELLARMHVAMRTCALQHALRARNAELERLVSTDMLTGCHNRRFLEDEGRRQVARARRHGGELSVLAVDVDGFKSINDRFGHEAGDAVLVEVGRRLEARLRVDDVTGRWGGDEFLVLAPSTGTAGARVLGEGLRRCIAHAPVAAGASSPVVTVSIGCASRLPDDELEDLVRRADEAMYAAKAAGRDTVVVAPSAQVSP